MIKEIDKNLSTEKLRKNYTKILTCMMPVIPHFTSECLKEIEIKIEEISWPSFDESLILEEKINLVVQINGKKRALLNIKRDLEEEKILEEIKKDKNLLKYIENISIKKKIFIPNKLINIII